MTVKKVLSYPDEQLRVISEPVSEFGDELKSLVQDMIDTIEIKGGAGLAAPQIGVPRRVLVIKSKLFVDESPDTSYSEDAWVLVNPIVKPAGSNQKWQEACLSVPMGSGNVTRQEECEVRYQRVDGTEHTVSVKWPLSGALQHENDHLNGILYVDRLGVLERDLLTRRIIKAQRIQKKTAERKREQDVFDLRGIEGLRKYRQKRNQAPQVKRTHATQKSG